MREGEPPCTRTSPPGSIHAIGQRGRVALATSSTPSQQECAVWPMHKDTRELIITQRVDETPLWRTLMWWLGLAPDAAAHRGKRRWRFGGKEGHG